MIYYAGWLFLVVISLGASLAAFIWALRAGQFSDQERARYLPLGKDLLAQPIIAVSRAKSRAHTLALCLIAATGFIAFAAALTLGLYHR
ncbi:MAG: cbb3-type cytochrome oxidase assembly protein CcoS [Syntrophobacteraceae bacterium]|jgi:cbb3-type cytochrome oxidase maturation protein